MIPTAARGGSQSTLREANEDLVLTVLRQGAATQAEVGRVSGLSGATVSGIVRELLQDGTAEVAEGSGRGQLVRLSRRSGLSAGIAFGQARAAVALGDLTSEVLGVEHLPLGEDAAGSVRIALEALDRLLAAQGVDRDVLLSVGVSLPLVRTGVTARVPGAWAEADVRAALEPGLGCPVLVDNDGNCGARGELRWGALQGRSDAAYVKASIGIGVGLVVQGRVHRGATGTAGELGHLSTDPAGPLCPCGGRGCLELSTSGAALLAELAAFSGRVLTLPQLVEHALSGDDIACRLVDEAGSRLGDALAGLVTLVDPEVLVVGGDLAASGDLFLAPLREALRRRVMPAVARRVEVRAGLMGDRAEPLGALALALASARPRRPAAVAS